jgi:hypothetical protein
MDPMAARPSAHAHPPSIERSEHVPDFLTLSRIFLVHNSKFSFFINMHCDLQNKIGIARSSSSKLAQIRRLEPLKIPIYFASRSTQAPVLGRYNRVQPEVCRVVPRAIFIQ